MPKVANIAIMPGEDWLSPWGMMLLLSITISSSLTWMVTGGACHLVWAVETAVAK